LPLIGLLYTAGVSDKLDLRGYYLPVIKQFKILHKLHIDGPVVNQMAKRGMV